ncbi:dihydroxyacetone kinase subunit L [Pollutimonas bauzanensis]|uniref:Dihydroxyacetone kinase, C-terminal domain n=1 Tax=Pollutimonas bauzanensis TaxID=658167 RepID=A0A1M5R189_9BURK|nr:dihydroxyacetone kinase subunit L [Pollutimonas bauzanensis]SHH19911.1 dihydroxyacetone kinase, C-terminal domain [Pollutimonas bauzanensis]
MPLTVDILRSALERCAARLEETAPDLNERDGQLGDGDLGATLMKCAANLRAALPELGTDMGQAFKICAMACSRASGSSFGTLLAIAFLTLAKRTEKQKDVPWADLPGLLQEALDAMSARGGAVLGDKTVLDALAAAIEAMRNLDDAQAQYAAARAAVAGALDDFRGKPNRIGRARMFAERSVGMDDPGMIAFQYMLESLQPERPDSPETGSHRKPATF